MLIYYLGENNDLQVRFSTSTYFLLFPKELIQANIVKASFWLQVKIFKLMQNMRYRNDQQFLELLLRVDDGEEHVVGDDMIRVHECMVIP